MDGPVLAEPEAGQLLLSNPKIILQEAKHEKQKIANGTELSIPYPFSRRSAIERDLRRPVRDELGVDASEDIHGNDCLSEGVYRQGQ
jgi:hypothetical protein